MGNRSLTFCRFENTARALRNCISVIQDDDVSWDDLDIYEVDALAELQLLAMDIIAMQDEIGRIIDSNKERLNTN